MKVSLNFEFNSNEEAEAFLRQVRERAAQVAPAPGAVVVTEKPEQPAKRERKKKEEPKAEVPAAVKQEDAQTALQKLFDAKGIQTSREVLSRYGVQRLQDMKAEHYAPFVQHVETVLAGGEV